MNWTRNENVVWEELDGCALLVDGRSGSRWTLDAAAAVAWKLCDGTRSLTEVARSLNQSRYSIAEFCRQFEALGLLHRRNAPNRVPVAFHAPVSGAFGFKSAGAGLGTGPRRRPTPRGNSGPG